MSWTVERMELCRVLGQDLSLPVLVQAMLASEEDWKEVAQFADNVMLQKEEAERLRRSIAAGTESVGGPPSGLSSNREDSSS